MAEKQTLKQLRPRLKTVAPLTFWISVGFASTNVAVWWLLTQIPVTAIKTYGVPISPNEVAFELWGYWFLSLAVTMVIALIFNSWVLTKQVLIAGLLSKLIWSYALLYMIINGIPAFATFILWAFLAWVQACTIIFFMPSVDNDQHKILPENKRYRHVK